MLDLATIRSAAFDGGVAALADLLDETELGRLVRGALLSAEDALQAHPHLAFPLLYGRLVWEHGPVGERLGGGGPERPEVVALLDRWRQEHDGPWLRALWPPPLPNPLGGPRTEELGAWNARWPSTVLEIPSAPPVIDGEGTQLHWRDWQRLRVWEVGRAGVRLRVDHELPYISVPSGLPVFSVDGEHIVVSGELDPFDMHDTVCVFRIDDGAIVVRHGHRSSDWASLPGIPSLAPAPSSSWRLVHRDEACDLVDGESGVVWTVLRGRVRVGVAAREGVHGLVVAAGTELRRGVWVLEDR